MGEKRENWMTFPQEYDLKLKPVHTIKGHGLCKLAFEAKGAPKKDLSGWGKEIEMYNVEHVPAYNLYPTS